MSRSTVAMLALALTLAAADFQPAGPVGSFSLVQEAQAVVGRPLTPVSVAGVARRTTRRQIYRTSVYVATLPPACTTNTTEPCPPAVRSLLSTPTSTRMKRLETKSTEFCGSNGTQPRSGNQTSTQEWRPWPILKVMTPCCQAMSRGRFSVMPLMIRTGMPDARRRAALRWEKF